MFFLLYKHTDDGFFDDFPKISTFRRFSKIVPMARRTFPNILYNKNIYQKRKVNK